MRYDCAAAASQAPGGFAWGMGAYGQKEGDM